MVRRATFLSSMQRIGRKKWRIYTEPAEVVWLKIDLFWPKWEWAKYLLFLKKWLPTRQLAAIFMFKTHKKSNFNILFIPNQYWEHIGTKYDCP